MSVTKAHAVDKRRYTGNSLFVTCIRHSQDTKEQQD